MNDSEKEDFRSPIVPERFGYKFQGPGQSSAQQRGYGGYRNYLDDFSGDSGTGTNEGMGFDAYFDSIANWAQDKATDNSSEYDDNRYFKDVFSRLWSVSAWILEDRVRTL